MKCQHCEKPATFHITELTEPDGPKVLHLCEEHARIFLSGEGSSPASALSGILAKQLKMDKAAEEIAASDKKTCPVCGITFAEFRKGGRLGCAYDYIIFEEDLEPLLINIHGALGHTGKIPTNRKGSPERQRQLAQLRDEMKKAIKKEEYENASQLRDQIAAIESGTWAEESESDEEGFESFQSEPPTSASTGPSTQEGVDTDELDRDDLDGDDSPPTPKE
ncbi:UvrB/uvrC motif protein [Pirellula sp. SH-Sr6A]|uniref:UvrB/UvrC motif-containing protein n=1 Tax=Pirellula sp. SH-Sr6A TaxID=1632865 RepID=UPI00078E15F4|nr:UvrB/UvrC motif-containing protein [Pirellula sp. SH-Sr6A]AMV31912.1 UvrB/uvrC motif protein [Pirellula sp. SH-Sr6A]